MTVEKLIAHLESLKETFGADMTVYCEYDGTRQDIIALLHEDQKLEGDEQEHVAQQRITIFNKWGGLDD